MSISTISDSDSNEKKRFFNKFITQFIFILAIFIIIFLSLFTIYQFNHLLKSNNLVIHTYKVISATRSALYHLTHLESRQRGYLLFNDQQYGSLSQQNIQKIKRSLQISLELTKDNVSQNLKLKKLVTQINERIAIIDTLVRLKKANKVPSPEATQLFYKGASLTDEIRALVNEITQVEFVLLNERNQLAIKTAKITNLIFIIGQCISISFLIIGFMLINRELSKRTQAEKNTTNIKNQLKSIIESASDMIIALDNNYRVIAFNHAFEREFQRLFEVKVHQQMNLIDSMKLNPNALNTIKHLWDRSLAGEEYVQEINLQVNDQRIYYEITSSLIRDEKNDIAGAVHINRDITERMNNIFMLNTTLGQLKEKNEKISLLLEMSDLMLACDSLDEFSKIVTRYCNKILDFSSGTLYIMHPSKDFLESIAEWGKENTQLIRFTPNQCWALRLGHIFHAKFIEKELICEHLLDHQPSSTSYTCVPLRAKTEIYGLIYIEIDNEVRERETDNDRLLINAFTELIALALSNIRLRENLSYQSIRDPLTSLYNRRYLEEFLLKQINQSNRTKKPIAVLLLDLDHFKRVNDIHGHHAGDMVLKELAELLLEHIRPGDIAARYGGEEFIVVLYDTNEKSAIKRAEEIRVSISRLRIKFGAQDLGKISISVGIAIYPQHGKNNLALIQSADKALYAAKNSGRNRVILFSELAHNLKNPLSETTKNE